MEMSEARKERLRDLALSGGLSGALLGGASTVLGGFKRPSELIKAALLGGATGAGLAAGSGYAGGELLGEPGPDEQGGHTLRGAVGGGLGGGLAGGALGATLGVPAVARKLQAAIGNQNFITRGLGSFLGPGGKASAVRGALVGALGLGAAGGYVGADEGMQMDFIEAMRREKARRERREAYLAGMGEI